MPHRAGHSLVPEFGFPQSWEMASQAIPGFMSPEKYRQIGRGLLDYVPGVSTALNWGEMGPWGRAGSVGLDALDLATAGGGKPATTALRLLSKGLRNIDNLNPLNPKMISFRGGLPPVDEFGNYTVSTSNLTGEPLEGVSAFQGAQFPFGRGTVIRPAINEYKTYTHLADPKLTLPLSSPLRSLKPGERYRLNPLQSQNEFLKQRAEDMYRIAGDVMPWAQGADLEALVNPATIRSGGITQVPFSRFRRLPLSGTGSNWPYMPTGLGSGTGLPLATEGMANRALNLFAKHDPQGTPLPINPNAIEQWLSRANLASTIPATVPARGVNYTWDTPGLFGGASPTNRGGWSPGG